MIGTVILDFLFSNVWRSVSLFMMAVLVMCFFMLKVKTLAVDRAELERDQAHNTVTQLMTHGKVQNDRINQTAKEVDRLKLKQAEELARLKELLKDWPEDCGEAASRAKALLKKRREG